MMKSKPRFKLLVPRRRARSVTVAALAVAAGLLHSPAGAQPRASAGRTKITVLTSPAHAFLTLAGESELSATSPIELEPLWTGRFGVTIEAPGHATVRGAIFFPEDGSRPTARSEPPGLTPGILLRSLNVPGVPHLLSHRTGRGAAFLAAGAGGLAAIVRNHAEYRDRRDLPDVESQDRAGDFRHARGSWTIYTGAVWGLSALDYIVRARMDLLESTPTRVTVGAPRLSRAAVVGRSILIPGAGQDYANRRLRGIVWLVATLASGAAYFVAVESRHQVLTKLTRAEALLATASPDEIAARQADVDHFAGREEPSRQLVNGLALGTAGIYVANIIDAGIVPLGGDSPGTEKVSVVAPVHPRRVEIALTYRF